MRKTSEKRLAVYLLTPIQHHEEEGWLISTDQFHSFRKIPKAESLLINSCYLIMNIIWEKTGIAGTVAPLISP